MADPVPLLHVVLLEDIDGNLHRFEVPGDVAAILEATEPALKERLLREPSKIETVADPKAKWGHWDGPRFAFSRLIGESVIWAGPPATKPCALCGGPEEDMDRDHYCLGCDRSGRDEGLRRPSKTEVDRLPNPARDAWSPEVAETGKATPTKLMPTGLAGGTGPVGRRERKRRRIARAG